MPTILTALLQSLLEPVQSIWQWLLQAIPNVIGAAIVLVFGYFVALFVSWLVETIAVKIKLNKCVMHATKFEKVIGHFDLSNFLRLLAKWYTFILFLPPAANILSLYPLSTFLLNFSEWVPQAIMAIIIGIVGYVAAEYAREFVQQTKTKASSLVAPAAHWAILIFTAIIVLQQLGINISLAEKSVLIVLAGIMLGLAIAFGIGFGLALKDDARSITKSALKHWK